MVDEFIVGCNDEEEYSNKHKKIYLVYLYLAPGSIFTHFFDSSIKICTQSQKPVSFPILSSIKG